MLGLQGNTSSSKEYQCVACSATFTGLASLLVHQATHAGSLSKPAVSNRVEASSSALNTQENNFSTILSPPMYICDCGDEFRAFTAMMDHKQSHAAEVQSPQSVDHESTKEDSSSTYGDTTADQTDAVLGEDSTAGPSIDESSSFKNIAADVNQEEDASVSSTEGQNPAFTEPEEQCDKTSAADQMPEEIHEEMIEDNDMDETMSKNKPLMQILASAYGKHLVSPPSVDNNIAMSLKEEPEVVVITPQITKGPSTVTDMQLKRLLGKPGMKTKAPSISRLLESSTKKIVSLTKIFSPVVLLETRQKFMDRSSDTYGKYQCSRCRKVFQDVDSLTEHHFMHKKERIKCCRCCKQLIIGRVPLPDSHMCPQFGGKITVSPHSFKRNPTNVQKLEQFNNPKKVYFCPICKKNFAQRYNLKMHKCHSLGSDQSQQTRSSDNAVCIRNGGNTQSIGINTQVRSIKVEDDSEPDFSNVSWTPLLLKTQRKSLSRFAVSQQVQDSQWTMPLSNEMDMLTNTKKDSSAKGRRLRLSTIVADGVRRYSCDKCHKTFGLSSNLCRHKKVCSVRSKGLGSRHSSNNSSLNANVPIFSCNVCGRNFNRKDNMIVHRRKCEQRRTMIPNMVSEITTSLPLPEVLTQDQTEEEDEGSWNIMSLPSVLPRRVTCECGIGFTSPKHLLEHLQKHTRESYTCPTCGVTVKSWADYEIHLQIHMHPQHHKRSQPLFLQFRKNTPDTWCQTANTPAEPAPQIQNLLKNQNRKQPFACPKCGNAFASRCSLRRHLTWSQCRGGGANISINYNLFSTQRKLPKQI